MDNGHSCGDCPERQFSRKATDIIWNQPPQGKHKILDTFTAQTNAIGKKILASLTQPYLLAGHEFRNSPSIGATLFNGHQSTIEELMKQADLAMYQAKKSGRSALIFFTPETSQGIVAQTNLIGSRPSRH